MRGMFAHEFVCAPEDRHRKFDAAIALHIESGLFKANMQKCVERIGSSETSELVKIIMVNEMLWEPLTSNENSALAQMLLDRISSDSIHELFRHSYTTEKNCA